MVGRVVLAREATKGKDRVVVTRKSEVQEKVERVPLLNPDWAGRQVIVAAFLYYVLDTPCMDDAKYDKLSRYVSDHFDEMSWERRWACGSAEAIRSSGAHIRFTSMAAGAALNRYKYMTGMLLGWHPDMKWKQRKKDGCHYITCGCLKPVPLKG